MLGKTARWLRMLGQDVEYLRMLDDEELINVAKEERRILLTRDLELFQKASTRDVKTFLVEGGTEAEKLAELALEFGFKLEIDIKVSRCPKCNSRIKPVSKEEVIEEIPESTSRFYDEFWRCSKCGQIYWQGSHWRRIDETLRQAKQIMESRKSGG